MSSSQTSGYEEIDRVFVRALPLVECALVQEYRLSPQEAAEIEQSLLEWFRGFGRRPGSPQSSEALSRHLLSMTCQAGHVFSSGRLGTSLLRDDRLQRTLTLGPQQIAIEIEARVEKAPEPSNRNGDDS
jgi:hypothetical protein